MFQLNFPKPFVTKGYKRGEGWLGMRLLLNTDVQELFRGLSGGTAFVSHLCQEWDSKGGSA